MNLQGLQDYSLRTIGDRVWCGTESEPVAEGRHPRSAALALAERLAAGRPYSLRELNPWQYQVQFGAPCTHTPASAVQKPEDVQP